MSYPSKEELRAAWKAHSESTRAFADRVWLAMRDELGYEPPGFPARLRDDLPEEDERRVDEFFDFDNEADYRFEQRYNR